MLKSLFIFSVWLQTLMNSITLLAVFTVPGTCSFFCFGWRKYSLWASRWRCIPRRCGKRCQSSECPWFHHFSSTGFLCLKKCFCFLSFSLNKLLSGEFSLQGYDTLVGERGSLLSGGQRQVISKDQIIKLFCRRIVVI